MAPTLTNVIGFDSRATTITAPSGTPYWDLFLNATQMSYVAGRNNGWALQIVEDGVTAGGTIARRNQTSATTTVFSVWGKGSANPAATSDIFFITDGSAAMIAHLSLNTSGNIRATAGFGTAQVGPVVTDGNWHLFECWVDTTTATWRVNWFVDGVEQTDATVAGTLGLGQVRLAFGSATTAHDATWTWDECMVSNTSADFPLSEQAAGEIGVQALFPNAEGTDVLNAGSPSNAITFTGAATGWEVLDELETGDAAAGTYVSYNHASPTDGAASNWAEVALDNVDSLTSEVWGVSGVAAVAASGGGTNALTVRVVDSGNTQLTDIVAGTTANATNISTLRAPITAPSGGWLAGIDGTKVRVGLATDTAPLPRALGVVLEVAAVIATTQTVTVELISQAGSVLAPAIVGQHSVSPSFIDNSPTLYAPSVVAQASFRNSFDNGTTGATITTGNSATSGDAFGGTGIGAGATLVYEATNTLHGAHSAAINPAAAVVCYMEFRPAALAEWYGRIYVKLSALPAGTIGLFVFRDSATAVQHGYVSILTTGQIRLLDANAATVATTTATLTAGSWSRIECRFLGHASAGVLEAKLFNTVESTTATETISGTGLDTNGTIDRLRFGQNNNPAGDVAVFYVDEPYFSPTGYPGPWTAPAQTVTVGLIDQSATVYAPSAVTQTVVVGLISQPGATFTPQVIGSSGGAQSVALPTIGFGWGIQPWSGPWGGGGASPFTLSQIKQNVVLGLLSNAGTALIHTVNPNRVNLSLISYVGVPFEPAQITQTVVVGLIDDAATAYEPVVQYAQTVTVGLISQAPTVYAMQFTPQTVTLTTTIDHGTTPFAPTIIVSPALSFINQSGTTFAPTIVAGQTVTVGLISNPPTVYDPTIAQFATQTVTLALLDNAGVVFEFADAALPGGQDVTVGLLSQAATAHEPRVYTVVPGFIHKKGIYRPTISKKGSYQPTIGKKGRFIA